MANVDTVTKNFVKDKAVFADAFNYYLYGGKHIIQPEQLRPVDTTEAIVTYGEDETGLLTQPVQRIRDAFYSVMKTDSKVYMLLGIENQTMPHNAMPVRNALYDMLEYAAQVQQAERAHRNAGNHGSDHHGQDFLSGFHSDDKLIPVYTLVIYWGPGKWTAPKSLFEMMDDMDEQDYYGLNDWKINLIIPDELDEGEVGKFNSDLGKALCYIKNMGKPDVVEKMSSNERFRIMSPEAVLVLNEIMNIKFPVSEKGEMTDMCYAMEKITEKAGVKAVIDVLRGMQLSDESILEKVMEEFNLTKEEAQNYMLQESA